MPDDVKTKISRRIDSMARALRGIASDVRGIPQTPLPDCDEKISVKRINESVAQLSERGYELLGGDAYKSGSEFFLTMVNRERGEVIILCPTFLRNSLRLKFDGSFKGGAY